MATEYDRGQPISFGDTKGFIQNCEISRRPGEFATVTITMLVEGSGLSLNSIGSTFLAALKAPEVKQAINKQIRESFPQRKLNLE